MSETSSSLIIPPEGYSHWLTDLKGRIHNAHQRAALAVKPELVQLYWQATAHSWRMNHSD